MKYVLLILTMSLVFGCASTNINEEVISKNLNNYDRAFVSYVLVESTEQNSDALETNEALKNYAETKLNALITKKYSVVDSGTQTGALSFSLKISVTYGNRALRWLAPGAGKGSVVSVLEVYDGESKKVLFSSTAESELNIGAAGGSMKSVVEENVEKLLKSFEESASQA